MNISKFVSWIQNDDETVIINTKKQKCIILDKSGGEIWNNLLNTKSLTDTIVIMRRAYPLADKCLIEKDITEI